MARRTMAMLYPVEFVRLAASLMPKEPEATTSQLWSVCLTRSSMPLSRNVLKTALIPLRRIRARSHSIDRRASDIRINAFSVAFGGKADMAYCTAPVFP
jgi:hypothetical protein